MSEREPIIGLLGAGNMASAMVSGWVRADAGMAGRILVTDRGSGRAAALAERLGTRHVAANADLVREADIVVLCVKPIDVERVLREVSDLITPKKMVASVAAGVGTATLETILDVDAPVFRFMPNVGVRVGAGTLAFSTGRFTDTAAEEAVLACFSLLGEVVPLEERLFDAATALSGSGPAFLGLIVEAFEDAGIVSGLTHESARPWHGRAARRREPRVRRPAPDGHVARRHGRRGPGRDGAARRARCDHRRGQRGQAQGGRARVNISTLEQFLYSLWLVYSLVIGLYIITSWLQLPPNRWVGALRTFLYDTVEPVLRPLRGILPPMGGLDLSPMIAIFGLRILLQIVFAILDGFR
jgi:pyrroline-5-carboxylate reductase